MKPPAIRLQDQTRRAERVRFGVRAHAPLEPDRVGNIEPLLAGDRQTEKRVAKARNPLQRMPFEVSLS
jgi:UDP-N-acetylglucosamine 2-epimerase